MKPTGNDGRYTFEDLVTISRRLLDPDGCPWDREQTIRSLRPYLIEEAHEVLDAIDAGDPRELAEELGDLLFQVVFQGNLAETGGFGGGRFDVGDIVNGIAEKLVRRHPHVFGDVKVADSGEVLQNWQKIKAAEKGHRKPDSVLDGVPRALAALPRAQALTHKAAKIGFDWPSMDGVFEKLAEELGELHEEIEREVRDPAKIEEELGDVLFVLANLARHLKVDAECALSGTNAKFIRRFTYIERALRQQGREAAPLEELDAIYEEGKARERAAKPAGGK